MSDLSAWKHAARKGLRVARDQAHAARDHTTAARLAARLDAAALIPSGGVLAGYMPIQSEIDIRPVLESHDGPMVLPRMTGEGQPLTFHRAGPDKELISGPFGTLEPSADAELLRPDVVLVPMLGFNARGYRLGYGKGFYDRTLAELRATGDVLAIGVAYEAQEMADLPFEETDEKMDWIVTPSSALKIGERA